VKEASSPFVAPTVPGFTLKKLLAASHRSTVHLATDRESRWVALKALRLPLGVDRKVWVSQWSDLQKLAATAEGLLPILEFGEVEGTDVWFYTTPAADDASDEAAGNPTLYNSLTLRLRLKVGGPLDISEVIGLGCKLAAGLERLHAAGLVHRDVKPSNIFFVRGEPRLGDYDLMLTPQNEITPRGTEGFYPLEEQPSPAADVYALGKTLYEAWTGLDRLEFPSLPPGLAGGRDWLTKGAAFNQVLLKACDVRPSGRFVDGAAFQRGLDRGHSVGEATSVLRRTRRRLLIIAGAVVFVALIGIWWLTSFPEATYDATKQFSATSNPSGVWSYGFSSLRLDAFALFPGPPFSGRFNSFATYKVTVTQWGRNLRFPTNHPMVMKNVSQAGLTRTNNLDIVMPAATLAVSSGDRPNPTYSIVRFTVPKSGRYSIEAVFSGIQFSGKEGGTTTDVHVLVNGSPVFDGQILGFGENQRYVSATPVFLSAGATVDFAVGPGINENLSDDWTGLTAIVRAWRR